MYSPACNRNVLVPLIICACLLVNLALASPPTGSKRAYTPICAFEFLSFRSAAPGKTFLEIFCQIPTDDLQFIKFDDSFVASYRLSIVFYDSLGQQAAGESFVDSVTVATFWDIDEPRPPKLVRFSFLLSPGDYEARIHLTDLETRREMNFNKSIGVPDYHTAQLSLSDLQIAADITPTLERNVLVKNKQKILPNIPRILNDELNVLQVYSEVYNLHFNDDVSEEDLTATYIVRNADGEQISRLQIRRRKPGDASFLTAAIPVEKLPSGRYQLTLEVQDLSSHQTVTKSTNFLIIRDELSAEFRSELLTGAFDHGVRF